MQPLPAPHVPSGEEIVDDRGVPVQDDWSIAPDDDKVRFSLSGVTPHSWGVWGTQQDMEQVQVTCAGGRGQGGGLGRDEEERRHWEGLSGMQRPQLLSSVLTSQPKPGMTASQGRHTLQSIPPAQGTASAAAIQRCSSGDTGHPAAVTWGHPRFPQDYDQLSF